MILGYQRVPNNKFKLLIVSLFDHTILEVLKPTPCYHAIQWLVISTIRLNRTCQHASCLLRTHIIILYTQACRLGSYQTIILL